MQLDFESKIADLLALNTPVEQIPERLIVELMNQKVSDNSIAPLGYFFLNSGQTKKLFSFTRELLEKSKPLPWGALALSLCKLNEEIPDDFLTALREGATEDGQIEALLSISRLCKMDARLRELKEAKKRERTSRHQEQRQVLIDKLTYLKSQRMVHEEGRTLEDFQKLFPGDPYIKSYTEEFSKRHAAVVVKEIAENHKPHKLLKRPITHSPVNLKWARTLLTHLESIVTKHPKAATDFSMLFYFLDFYEEALYVLNYAPSSPSTDWLRLELKILSRRYVDAIEEARSLEQKYALDPEATFATTYARALCLWELGQEGLAISILQGIIKIRPQFRSAVSLLQQWRQELV